MSETLAYWEKTRKEVNFTFMDGDINNLIKESREGAEKIGKIVSDLRTLACPDHGMDGVNIEVLMESMLNIVHTEIKYKAELKREFSNVPLIVCNPQKIGQVFVNILMNAAQAIDNKGTITVKTYTQGNNVCIDITDTGCGIIRKILPRFLIHYLQLKAPEQGLVWA